MKLECSDGPSNMCSLIRLQIPDIVKLFDSLLFCFVFCSAQQWLYADYFEEYQFLDALRILDLT